jgi:hypothetical protein
MLAACRGRPAGRSWTSATRQGEDRDAGQGRRSARREGQTAGQPAARADHRGARAKRRSAAHLRCEDNTMPAGRASSTADAIAHEWPGRGRAGPTMARQDAHDPRSTPHVITTPCRAGPDHRQMSETAYFAGAAFRAVSPDRRRGARQGGVVLHRHPAGLAFKPASGAGGAPT